MVEEGRCTYGDDPVMARSLSDATILLWYKYWSVWYAIDAEAFQCWKADQGFPEDRLDPPHETTPEGLRWWYASVYVPWYRRNQSLFAYAKF